ncbi:M1 family metallopeptidase [Luteipulveratus sp. YIM 133132]|uniref:M1 family metallopeptidase n=1 Tax=Luteipulveratus flavus TaxID=3031728 RepID=UPI0023AEFD97|nr:M1 family metallopeptidase [Luteipulveratus sp. YIM 133132]MDE9366392.1 M1 family metallopeptidase [Luteipulveratus sp. YIM 133132]
MKSVMHRPVVICGVLALSFGLAGCERDAPRSAGASTPVPAPSTTAAGFGPTNASGTPTTAPTTLAPTPTPTMPGATSVPRQDSLYPKRGNPDVDALHYDLDLAWDRDSRTLTGTATVLVRPVTDRPVLELDLSHALTVDSVTIDGTAATAAVTPRHKLTVPVPMTKDVKRTVVIRYHGKPDPVAAPTTRSDLDEGLGLRATSAGHLWTMQEPYGAFTWYPVNDIPSDKATYDISVRAPKGWAGVASGTPASAPAGTNRFVSTRPVASYLTTLAVGPYTKHVATGPHDLPLSYWTRPSDGDELRVLRRSPRLLTWLEKRFGRYPFASAGAVVVDSRAAMETQQLVTFGGKRSAGQTNDDTELTVVHEYAHQWFGDEVGPSTWTDVWLNEGWAMYIELLYQVDRDNIPQDFFTQWLARADGTARKKYGPPGHPDRGEFGTSNVYLAPANMLHQIHRQLGDKKFYALARAWVSQHQGQAVDRQTFTTFVNQHTGRDFAALINRYLDSTTTPRD